MKKFCVFVLVFVLLFTVVLTAACNHSTEKDQLIVYNWSDYIYDENLEDFKAYYLELTGREIEVTYVTFDTNETMLTKILNGDSVVDVMCPSEYAIQKLLEQDLLLPLNYFSDNKADYIDYSKFVGEYVHNKDNVNAELVEKVQNTFATLQVGGKHVDITDYFVPYMYGTLGILYNKEYFAELGIYDREIMNKANWGILFNDNGEGDILAEGLTNRIYMKDSIRDSYAATVFYLKESGKLDGLTVQDGELKGTPYTELTIGELINCVDDQIVAVCSQVLKKQKEQLYGYEVDFGKNELIQGIAYVDLAWSGDALYAVEESWDDDFVDSMLEYEEGESGGYKLGYYVPHGSGNIWFDGWVIPKTCAESHLDAAKLFINFLNLPSVAAQNMMEIGYTSAVDMESVRADSEARTVLAEGYNVYSTECREDLLEAKDFATAEEFEQYVAEFDYASWEEFEEYFFDDCSPVDDSNWRYPFVIAEDNEYERSLDDLGVMKDFGANNYKVATMWEDVRSTGITVWALLGWTTLVLAVAVGIIALVVFLQRRSRMRVIIKKAE